MLEIMPFQPAHLRMLKATPAQQKEYDFITALPDVAWSTGDAFSAFGPGGIILCCAGVRRIWENRAVAWAFFSSHAVPRDMIEMQGQMRKILDLAPYARIEATTVCGFLGGCNWLKRLGFECEGHLKRYDPLGNDHWLYARIK